MLATVDLNQSGLSRNPPVMDGNGWAILFGTGMLRLQNFQRYLPRKLLPLLLKPADTTY